MMRILAALMLGALTLTVAAGAPAEAQPARKAQAPRTGPLSGFGGNSKEPIHIEAAQLQVFDKEQRAVYTGDVVAVQGKSTLRCSKLTIFYDNKQDANAKPKAAPAGQDQSSIRKLDCEGPVSVVSCTQTATGDHGVYEASTDLVTLTGNVVLADGPNVQNGDKLVYNLKDGTATVTSAQPRAGGRVGGIFVPGSDASKNSKGGKGAPRPAPKGSDSCS